jgi:hypothetical protein
MTYKKIYKSVVLVFALGLMTTAMLFMGSCNDFLAERPTSNLINGHQYDGPDDMDALKNGPYRDIQLWDAGAGTFNYLPLQFEYFTGEAVCEDAHISFNDWKNDRVTGGLLDNFNTQWQDWFQGVRDANFSINTIRAMTGISDDQRSEALGEVRTIRAYFYFNLVRYFGDVPMFTKNPDNPSPAATQLPRTSLKTIYDKIIIPDLEYAVDSSALLDAASTDGRVTKYVSRALLADVYLTCAGYPYQEVATDTSKDWCEKGLWSMTQYPVPSQSAKTFLQNAQKQLNVLYNAYSLGQYSDLRMPSRNNKGGLIWEVQYKSGVDNNDLIRCMFPNASKMSQYGSPTGSFVPSMPYYNSFATNDKRRDAFFYDQDTYAQQYDPTESTIIHFARPYLYKYYDRDAIKGNGESGLNWPLYRYAGICLMLTEVNWTLNQLGISVPANDITKGINKVRARAGLTAYSASQVNLKTIMAERAYELIFENKMIWDQRRTRKCLIDGNHQFAGIGNFVGHKSPVYNFAFGVKNLLAPIPTIEITRNHKAQQNFQYTPQQGG